MIKINSTIDVNYDRDAFIDATVNRVWIATDTDAINPVTTYSDDDEELQDTEFSLSIAANKTIFVKVNGNRQAGIDFLRSYIGYPIQFTTGRNRGRSSGVNQGAAISINAWLGNSTSVNSSSFHILNGDGNPITAPATESSLISHTWVASYTAPINGGLIYSGENNIDASSSFIITKPNRQEARQLRQPRTILNNLNARDANLRRGIIKTNNLIIPDDINRSKKFRLIVDDSVTQTGLFQQVGNIIQPSARHIIRGRVFDRVDAGFDFTPTILAANEFVGMFNVNGNDYNMTQFIEHTDNIITIELESV